MTLGNLTSGSVVTYTDQANPRREGIVLDSYTDKWGAFTTIIWKDDNSYEDITSHTEIHNRVNAGWALIQERTAK